MRITCLVYRIREMKQYAMQRSGLLATHALGPRRLSCASVTSDVCRDRAQAQRFNTAHVSKLNTQLISGKTHVAADQLLSLFKDKLA